MLTLLVLISAAVMAQTTIDFTKLTWSSPLVQSPYTFSADKNNGSTAPTQNGTAKDIRLYAKNTLTISTSGEKICTIVFHISTNGLKQWAEFTPNNGSVTVSKEKRTTTWENTEGATSITFTVGSKCKYGTAAATKAGQFFFDSVDITELDAATPPTTTTTFGADSGKTFTFTNGTLEGFTAPTATATKSDDNTNLSNLIEYASSDADIVAVDSKTGELTFTNTKFGKAIITATLPKTATYQTSTDSYVVVNKDNHIATSLSFNGTDVTLTEGKTDAGTDFAGYTATEASNIAGTITYAASGDAVATVDPKTGTVTINAKKYGSI